MQRADDVGVDVGMRVFHPVADPRLSGEVNDPLRPRLGEQPLHTRAVGEVQLVEGEALAPLKLAEARLLQLNVIVGIEIIEADNLIAPVEQRLSGMVTDETGGAGDQHTHMSYSRALGPNARVLMTPAIPPAGAK